jgi:hypothetical protein
LDLSDQLVREDRQNQQDRLVQLVQLGLFHPAIPLDQLIQLDLLAQLVL